MQVVVLISLYRQHVSLACDPAGRGENGLSLGIRYLEEKDLFLYISRGCKTSLKETSVGLLPFTNVFFRQLEAVEIVVCVHVV